MKAYSLNSAEEVLKSRETAYFLTSGASMKPLLRTHKDIVVIRRVPQPFSVGEVVLYKKAGADKLVLHRIIGVKQEGTYIIRGDNTYSNEYVPQSDILGVMTAVYRSGKYIDCKKSVLYKIYVKLNRFFYPARRIFKTKILAFSVKIKRKIFRKKCKPND